MVGEAQRPAVRTQLALLLRPGQRRREDVEAATQKVIDRAWTGGSAEAETVLELLEDAGVLTRAQIEVTAEEQRRARRPLGCGTRRFQHVGGGECRPIVGRVQVGDADARGGAGERHRASLRAALVDRELALLDDLPKRAIASHQGQVRAALSGGDQVRVEAGGRGAQGAE